MATFIFTIQCLWHSFLHSDIYSDRLFIITQPFLCRGTPWPKSYSKTPGHNSCDLPALLCRNTQKKSLNYCCFPLKTLNFHLVLHSPAQLCFLGYFQAGSWTLVSLVPLALSLPPPRQQWLCFPACGRDPSLLTIFGTKNLYFRIRRRSVTF